MLPGCGHSFCADCIDRLPLTRTRGQSPEAACPICRAQYTPGTRVPNWTLRDTAGETLDGGGNAARAATTTSATTPASAGQAQPPPHGHSAPRPDLTQEQQQVRPAVGRSPVSTRAVANVRPDTQAALRELGVPPALRRLACEEADRVAVRVFLLDNSGSTAAHDGHLLHRVSASSYRVSGSTRWQEICQSAQTACALGAATGVPCEFHLLNPVSGWSRGASTGLGAAGVDWIRTTGSAADVQQLSEFLHKVNPGGVTPLAERLRALSARFEGLSGRVAFLVIITDGAPTELHSGTPTARAARAALDELRRLTVRMPVRLVVRLCTDDDAATGFWNSADAEEELPLDVLDDLLAEAREVASCGNGWLAYTPSLHMLREVCAPRSSLPASFWLPQLPPPPPPHTEYGCG
jgi:hypothetical protein